MRIYLLILIVIGFFWGGFLGALFGGLLGAWFIQAQSAPLFHSTRSLQKKIKTQRAFFKTTFLVMGYLAKKDGHISQAEIHIANQLMEQMRLTTAQKKMAIALFNQGKSQVLNIPNMIADFKKNVISKQLHFVFLEIQLQVASADGNLHQSARYVLLEICTLLDLPASVLEELQRQMQANHNFHDKPFGSHQYTTSFSDKKRIQEAYNLLKVTSNSTLQEIKTAYRKLINRHHPDKLIAKGLPESMLEIEKQKAQKIQAAYELLQIIHKKK
ncbi:MAG: co-chaperone DjlA [Endozoicomonadaceae bacterium]|nr:co-chaperone DjlA [Endozoicomonadaceae bacterium]